MRSPPGRNTRLYLIKNGVIFSDVMTSKDTTRSIGSVRAFQTVQLQANVSGFLKSQAVDIGDRVKRVVRREINSKVRPWREAIRDLLSIRGSACSQVETDVYVGRRAP